METHTDKLETSSPNALSDLGIVMSGGGSRAAYQLGALRAVNKYLAGGNLSPSVLVGTSVGAINSIVFGAALQHGAEEAIKITEDIWRSRTFSNTFSGSIPKAFLKAIQVAFLRYGSPGPQASAISIFNPEPLKNHIQNILNEFGGIQNIGYAKDLSVVAVMTTVEGNTRKPLLLGKVLNEDAIFNLSGASFDFHRVNNLGAAHGLASAALPSVLPAVDLDLERESVRLVDGGICDNIPVDPAMRLGARNVILIDSSGRRWWFDHYGEPHDTRPTWEVPSSSETFCLFPDFFIECRNRIGLGTLLKQVVGKSTKHFIQAAGPTWPIFKILKHKMGEELAYEVMSYVALHPEFTEALLECGYNETEKLMLNTSWVSL